MNVGKRGWIRIVEASIAILLVAVVLLIIISQEDLGNKNPPSEIYDSQLVVLRDIQMNNTLRQSVLSADIGGDIPQDIQDRIKDLVLDYLECEAKICEIESDCNLDISQEKDIYAQSVMITVTTTQVGEMNPRQLKLFCTMIKLDESELICAGEDDSCGDYPCEDCTKRDSIKSCVLDEVREFSFECDDNECKEESIGDLVEDCEYGCSEEGGVHCLTEEEVACDGTDISCGTSLPCADCTAETTRKECVGDELHEYLFACSENSCEEESTTTFVSTCPYGCSNGACIEEEPSCAGTNFDCGVYPGCDDCTTETIEIRCSLGDIYQYPFVCGGDSCIENPGIIRDCPDSCSETGGAHCCRARNQFCMRDSVCCSRNCRFLRCR